MRNLSFIRAVCVYLLVFCLLYVGVFLYQLGADWQLPSADLHRTFLIKEHKAYSLGEQPKVIVQAGSNALFGIDSAALGNILQRPVLNLGVHVHMDLEYLYFKLQEHMQPGDILVMPLEYDYYLRDGYTDLFVNNMMYWGADFFYSLSLREQAAFLTSASLPRVAQGVWMRWQNGRYLPPTDSHVRLQQLLRTEGVQWRGYNYLSLDLDGDVLVDAPGALHIMDGYLPSQARPAAGALRSLQKIKALAQQRQVTLIMTHPITFRNSQYDLNLPEHRARIERFTHQLRQAGVELQCNPAQFHLEADQAFDTLYHPRKSGALLRSQSLGYCLRQVLESGASWLTYDEAARLLQQLEASQQPDNF